MMFTDLHHESTTALADPQPAAEPDTAPAILPFPATDGSVTSDTPPAAPIPASAPAQLPPPGEPPSGMAFQGDFTNFVFETSQGITSRRGRSMHELGANLLERTGGWPQRVGEALFVRTPDHQVLWLDKSVRFYAWLNTLTHVEWAGGTGMITRETFFQHLKMTSTPFDAVETGPHFPPMPSVCYIHPPLPTSTGQHFEDVLASFSTATPEDRELLRAFFMTLFWGGRPGKRPVFMFTSSDNDPNGGVGVGKSTVVELASQLVGGYVDVSLGDNFSKVKTRLLSPTARGKRIVRIDNIKQRVEMADLEAMITSPIISGHEMHRGEGTRPNTLVWCLTVNAATVTRDFAQRCVIIQLQRPANNPTWFTETADFIKTNKWQIIADIGHALTKETQP